MMTPRVCAMTLATLLLAPCVADSQTTLTGAMWFATTSAGGTTVSQAYADGANNTLGGDQWWNLWLALNPDATSPVNGPSDLQSSISIPLEAGRVYRYYLFGQGPCCTLPYSALNLFFDGNSNTPGISVFGPLESSSFTPNSNASTFTLEAGIVPASGTGYYTAGGLTVVLIGFEWHNSGTLDVCQAFEFVPGTLPSATGLLMLRVFGAAGLSTSLESAPPGTQTTLTGSGFAPLESVRVYFGSLASVPVAVTADSSGAFTQTLRVPPASYGPHDVYAVGEISGRAGAVSLFITPHLAVAPHSGNPGGTELAQGFGFAAGESVQVYWANPRQFLGTAVTNGSGSFTGKRALEIVIPANAPPGRNALIATGDTSGAVAIGEVIVN